MSWCYKSTVESDPVADTGFVRLANDGVNSLYIMRSTPIPLIEKFSFSDSLVYSEEMLKGYWDMAVKGLYVYSLVMYTSIERYLASDGTLDGVFYNTTPGIVSMAATDTNWFVANNWENKIYKLSLLGVEEASWAQDFPQVVRTDGVYLFVSDTDTTKIKKYTTAGDFILEWDTEEDVTNLTLAVGPDGRVYQLRADGVTIRVYTNDGIFDEDITIDALTYPNFRGLTVATDRLWVSSGEGGT